MVLSSIVDPVLKPFLAMPPLYAIISISFIIAVIISLVYKQMTDQSLMKTLKDDIKKYQKEMKELRHDPKKVMEIQKKAMETNMKYMMKSMKPTLITFIPIILIFGWLQGNLAFEPIIPGNEFNTSLVFKGGVTGSAELVVPEGIEIVSEPIQNIVCYQKKSFLGSKEICESEWVLKGNNGEYIIEYKYKDKNYNREVLITTKQKYNPTIKGVGDGIVESMNLKNNPLKPLNLFGWKLGWLGTYIIFSIVFSMGLRKLMKLH